ncbi:hypothetical protein LEP1GSC193_3111 [Leptospira alstonii serovar Pingchang str. 80-412]|uniref:Uncharacterized protein n=2 Tax=Leptospira alstonii TaxID=28452 RepID=M6D8U9_9LEPT|nr:hypothetical protein LEP1GSC194_2719 [Leptospira alstonii serovar Sichuan str. 79601]EQA78929.1 hypothetical protein LEP1GSC193_3111 [Leptospira alstonii serovar Pingchang str. 80-412]
MHPPANNAAVKRIKPETLKNPFIGFLPFSKTLTEGLKPGSAFFRIQRKFVFLK